MDVPLNARRLTQRISSLDGPRAVLAVLIAAYHLGAPGTRGAVLALPTFYALSGSLITSLLLAEFRRDGSIRIGRFVVNRSLRIVPPILVLVAVVAALWPLVGDFGDPTTDRALAVTLALTWTTNIARAFFGERQGVFDPLWSLSAEEQFYLVWPPLVALLLVLRHGRRWLLGVLAVIVVAGPVVCVPLYAPSPDAGPAAVYYAPPLSMSSLAAGCCAALLLDRFRTRGRWSDRIGRAATWSGAAALAALMITLPADWRSNAVAILIVIPAAGLASAVLVTGLGTTETALARALSVRPLSWFGARASYSLYIWHLPVAALVLPHVDGVAGRALALGLALLTGLVGGLLIEQPADRLRRWVVRRAWPR